MNGNPDEHAPEIDTCLRKWCASVRRPADRYWEMTLRNGAALAVRALIVEEWLQLDAALASVGRPDGIRSALAWNGSLAGGAKFALMSPASCFRVRAEIPLDRGSAVAADLGATLAGFAGAASLMSGAADGDDLRAAFPAPPAEREEVSVPLGEALAESGWTPSERPGGSFMVDLDTGSDFRQALVQDPPDGGRRASAELVRWESPAPASRTALSVLLLTASGVIRMARPVIEETDGRLAARVEFRLAPQASPALLGRGLAALSVACRLCAREAAILNNERIAARYLALRGFTVD